jgi:hypothetical protein
MISVHTRLVLATLTALAAVVGSGSPLKAAAKDDLKFQNVPTRIPLQVDTYLVNKGSQVVVVVVRAERFQGGKKIDRTERSYQLSPGDFVAVGKAQDSLITTQFTIVTAFYRPSPR